MEKLLILLILVFIGCSDNPVAVVFEPELFTLEIKEWEAWPTNNSSNAHPAWNGRAGIVVGHSIWGDDNVDLKVEYELIIRGARLREDIVRLIPIHEAPFIMSVQGLICKKTNVNLNPMDIIESNIIPAGERVFGIAFAESVPNGGYWDDWYSIYYSVIVRAYTFESLGKGRLMFEYESEFIEVILL